MARWANGGIISKLFGPNRPRGAVVPFDTPMLRMARVCDDERDGLIAILRDFANNGAAYIVPWTSLPLMTTMTNRDLALHEGISESKSTTPAQVRAVVSELALSGILGPEAKDRETGRVQAERTQLADLELVLILHLLSSCGAGLAGMTAGPFALVQPRQKQPLALPPLHSGSGGKTSTSALANWRSYYCQLA